MKKIILFVMLAGSVFAYQYDAKFYMGVGGAYQDESFTTDLDSTQTQNNPTVGILKFGYGDIKAYSIEILLNYVMIDQKVFSDDDNDKYGLDIAFVKAFNFSKYFYPYARAGFGGGEMKIKNAENNKLGFSSFNVGVGSYIPLFSHLELEVNYEYRFTSYEEVVQSQPGLQSHINQLYVGINTRF